MDDKPHKAHRPAHSGTKADKKDKAKGKEKERGFNEKVSKALCVSFFF
jgi:ribosome biogenesis protein BMS1